MEEFQDLRRVTPRIEKEPIFAAEFGIPVPDVNSYMDLADRAQAACRTLVAWEKLAEYDLESLPVTEEHAKEAGALVNAYVDDPTRTSKQVSTPRFSSLPNATILLINQTLQTYSHALVQDAQDLRNYVTNRLIEESDNEDPRIRMKALELLGKVSDVGLFTDKSEVTVRQDPEQVRNQLRSRLEKLVKPIERDD